MKISFENLASVKLTLYLGYFWIIAFCFGTNILSIVVGVIFASQILLSKIYIYSATNRSKIDKRDEETLALPNSLTNTELLEHKAGVMPYSPDDVFF
jgi:predicted membrane protein